MSKEYTYKFRLYPTEKQKVLLAKHFGCTRFVYNYFLNRRNEFYKENKKSLNYYDNAQELTELKKQEETGWLYECNAQSLQQSLKNLDAAFKNFFKKKSRFPKFKSRKNKQSFRVQQHIRIKNNKIYIIKFPEGIKYDNHREIEGKIQNATISCNPSGQYFVSILVKKEIQEKPKLDKQVGIDLGIKILVVCSDGVTYENIKPLKNLEKRLRIKAKSFSRTKSGSKGREKARKSLAKVHNKISNIRNNHLHQISSRIINENQVIVLEDLNVSGMVKNRKLSKSISDCSWSELVMQLVYKANWYGRQIVKVSRFYPSSKTCGNCGFVNKGLTLADRFWTCPECFTVLDRDLNAAKNILKQGTVGTTGIAECLSVRPSLCTEGRRLTGSETYI